MSGRPTIAEAMDKEEEWPNWPLLPVVKRAETKAGAVVPRLTQEDVQPEHAGKAVVFVLNMFAQPVTEDFLRGCEVEVFDDWEAADAAWRVD